MGHVDHGKTTLMDALRGGTNVADREAGKITQSIGAFTVELKNADNISTCTILDTPGHSAFKSMRNRGSSANLIDIVILVVSAVDNVQPQTVEAITLAKKNNRPLIVAVNKCDVPGVNPDAVLNELSNFGVVCEKLGGDVLSVNISAKTGLGLDELLENIALMADIIDLRVPIGSVIGYSTAPLAKAKAAPKMLPGGVTAAVNAATVNALNTMTGQAFVVEAFVAKGAGVVINCIVRSGVIKVGDYFVCGLEWGTVKQLKDEKGNTVTQAGISCAAQLIGAKGVELLGDDVQIIPTEERAKGIASYRKEQIEAQNAFKIDKAEALNPTPKNVPANRKEWKVNEGSKNEKIFRRSLPIIPTQEEKDAEKRREDTTLNCMFKGDVMGSIEALTDYASTLSHPDVNVRILKSGLGEITEADVEAAILQKMCIFGFNVKASPKVLQFAKDSKVHIFTDKVIFHVFDEIRLQLQSRLPKVYVPQVDGTADVLDVFQLRTNDKKLGYDLVVAGCKVTSGSIGKDKKFRLLRDGMIMFDGPCASLKIEKEEVSTIEKGNF
jgi:translation initiation factor IF-2